MQKRVVRLSCFNNPKLSLVVTRTIIRKVSFLEHYCRILLVVATV